MTPWLQITEDIYQVNVPLPFRLDHVHCYLLRDDEGWVILDTGLNWSKGREVWPAIFDALRIEPATINRIILTHTHPDHYGLAGWLQNLCGAPVWLSPREARQAQQYWQSQHMPATMLAWLHANGIPADLSRDVVDEISKLRNITFPHPEQIETLLPGTRLQLGQRTFEVLLTPGHSDGHLIFYDAHDQLLLCGDQVLLNITPNISLWPMSDPDPLGRYLASLRELTALEVRLALPGHGPSITDWPGRLAELIEHHDKRLAQILTAINGTGLTAFDICPYVFDMPKLSPHEVRFAVAEILAHLELLVSRGRLQREGGEIRRYCKLSSG